MKKMNRREFLTLTGAAVVALSLAGCGGGSSAPAVPTGKEAELVAAINKVWKEKYATGAVDHEQLTLNQDAVDLLSAYGHVFEKANETPHIPTADENTKLSEETLVFAKKMQNYGNNPFTGIVGVTAPDSEGKVALNHPYSCADTAVLAFVDKLLDSNPNSRKAEFISIYLPVVDNVTYMTAAIFLNDKA